MAHKDDLIAEDILGYLEAQENKSLLRFITCGSVVCLYAVLQLMQALQ